MSQEVKSRYPEPDQELSSRTNQMRKSQFADASSEQMHDNQSEGEPNT